MGKPRKTSGKVQRSGYKTPKADKRPRLFPKRVIKRLAGELNRSISKEKKLISSIADNIDEISEIKKSEYPLVSGIMILENENLQYEVELEKIRNNKTGIEGTLMEKLTHNNSILQSRIRPYQK